MSQPSEIERLLAKALHTQDDNVGRSLARKTFFDFRPPGPPFQPEFYAKLLGLRIELSDMAGDGFLTGSDTVPRILLRKPEPVTTRWNRWRQNFTLAHELGHYLLRSELRQQRLAPSFAIDDPGEERVCNAFAAELLMPEDVFLKDLDSAGVSPRALFMMCERYGVNLTAVLRRVSTAAGRGRFFAVVWRMREEQPSPSWAWPKHFKSAILVDTGKTSVEKAFADNGEFHRRDQLLLSGTRETWHCASMRLVSKNKVLTVGRRSMCRFPLLVHPSSEIAVEQLSLFRQPRKGKKEIRVERLNQVARANKA